MLIAHERMLHLISGYMFLCDISIFAIILLFPAKKKNKQTEPH